MSKNVIGYYTDELDCVSCATEGEPATSEAIPDGFTCATCGVVIAGQYRPELDDLIRMEEEFYGK